MPITTVLLRSLKNRGYDFKSPLCVTLAISQTSEGLIFPTAKPESMPSLKGNHEASEIRYA